MQVLVERRQSDVRHRLDPGRRRPLRDPDAPELDEDDEGVD
ncbi:hypothetical protein [Streptomyces sp. NBC_01618]|nr:hypothetical protein OH735_01480 [Streptomyces sp. NBC_01618]